MKLPSFLSPFQWRQQYQQNKIDDNVHHMYFPSLAFSTYQAFLALINLTLVFISGTLPMSQGFTPHSYVCRSTNIRSVDIVTIGGTMNINSRLSHTFLDKNTGKGDTSSSLYLFNGGAGSDRNSDNYKQSSLATLEGYNDINSNNDQSTQSSSTPSSSTLRTFNTTTGGISGGLQMQQWYQRNMKNQKSIQTVLDELEYSKVTFPYTFEMKEKTSASNKKRLIQIRHMEMKDLQKCVTLCLKEYGKYSSINKNDAISLWDQFQSKMDDLDNFIFSFVVLLGLEQRVTRRMKGDTSASLPDHNVIIISELIPKEDKDQQQKEREEIIFGMAEISLQPPDPSRTAPPFVVPTSLKSLLADITSSPIASAIIKSNKASLCAYVSNVLITNEYRSKGYSKLLMAACHGIARSWQYNSTFLHVDADFNSGRAAQQLYRKLGYKPFVDESYNDQFTWMGIEAVNRGLYIVDGVPLLFLKKDL